MLPWINNLICGYGNIIFGFCVSRQNFIPLEIIMNFFFLSLEWWATAGDRKECDRSGTKIPQIYVLVRSTKCCNLEMILFHAWFIPTVKLILVVFCVV